MNLGRMNTFISICKPTVGKDDEGFPTKKDVEIANVRAYREGRHGSEKWANRAVFSEATDSAFGVFPIQKLSQIW